MSEGLTAMEMARRSRSPRREAEMVHEPTSPRSRRRNRSELHISNERHVGDNNPALSPTRRRRDVEGVADDATDRLQPAADQSEQHEPPLASPDIDDQADTDTPAMDLPPTTLHGDGDHRGHINGRNMPNGEAGMDSHESELGGSLADHLDYDREDRYGGFNGGFMSPQLTASIPDVNTYQQKKNLAQGMMDLALLSANANQLRYVLESSKTHPYFYPSVAFISISIILQVLVGVGLIINSRYDVKDKKEICIANKVNNFTVIGIFLITIVNVFIASFSVASPGSINSVPRDELPQG